MKVYLFLSCLLFLLFQAGCSDKIISPADEFSDYFPLNKGNSWNFIDDTDTYNFTVMISDEFTSETHKYYLLRVNGENSPADTITLGNNIIYILKNNVKEQWINFNLKDNDTYNFGNAMVLVKTNLIVSTKLGEFKNCISFNFDVPNIADDEVSYYFAKGIGLVKISYSGGRPFVLKDYKLY